MPVGAGTILGRSGGVDLAWRFATLTRRIGGEFYGVLVESRREYGGGKPSVIRSGCGGMRGNIFQARESRRFVRLRGIKTREKFTIQRIFQIDNFWE